MILLARVNLLPNILDILFVKLLYLNAFSENEDNFDAFISEKDELRLEIVVSAPL